MTELDKAKQEAWENYEYEEGNLYSTSFNRGFELGAKWQEEQYEQLKDFDTWKEWKNGSMPDL
jgi:hypothetical protein